MKPRRAEFLIMLPHPVQRGFELMSMQIHCGPKTKVPHIRSKPFAGLQTHDKDSQMLHIFVLLFFFVVTKSKGWGPGARTPGPGEAGSDGQAFFP